MATILVVDDELGSRSMLSDILSDEGHEVALAENAAQARAYRDRVRPDLVFLDIWMPGVDGITLLKEWGSSGQLTMPVVMLSGYGSIEGAVEATKFGAIAFLEKPINLQKLLSSVGESLAKPASRVATTAVVAPSGAGLPTAGGAVPSVPPLKLGPQPERTFDLDRPLRVARDEFEKSYFEFHLAQEDGSMTRVSEKTGIERTHLYRKLKQLGLDSWRHQHRQVAVSAGESSAVIRSLQFRGVEPRRRETDALPNYPANDDA